ncbi:hypothetical protein B566_EDAN004308 [Ephemera danica]|nr:hypothetical protein B566_EDAN004308 [Ephemera danica]
METSDTASLKRPSSSEGDSPDNKKIMSIEDTNDVNCESQEINPQIAGLSKSQLKKLKRKEMWQKSKQFRRAKEKEKLRQKKIAAKINNVSLGPSRKLLKNAKMATSECKVSVSLGKCNKQMLHCYSMNRRAANPMQLYFTSLTGRSQEQMAKHDGYQHWDVHLHSEHFTDVFPKTRLVYLTSESPNILDTLEDDKVYIIGGLVDHNAHKGHCWEVAKNLGINHAQLPISQYLEMKTRQVLTIDHVFAIMLHVSEGCTWKEALLKVLPQRKGAKEKDESKLEETSNQESLEQSHQESLEQPQQESSTPDT